MARPAFHKAAALLLAAAAVVAVLLPGAAQAYEFDMVFQTKCVMEEVQEHEEVQGHYFAFNKDHPDQVVQLDARFEDPAGHTVYENHGASDGDFHFTSGGEGEYKMCFTAKDYHTAQNTRVRLEWHTGAEAHDWMAVAKKENLNVIQTELRKLEHVVHSMHLELQSIRRKEEQMRDVNEATNARVAWFNITAALVCVTLCGWQLWYLNKFFKRKKVL